MLTALRTFFSRWFHSQQKAIEIDSSPEEKSLPLFLPEHQERVNPSRKNDRHSRTDEPVPYDENLLERARTQWQFGDWASLANLERAHLQNHPDRAKLAILAASGLAQLGKSDKSRQFVRLARGWGCSEKLIRQILISGVHNNIGRAAALVGDAPRALIHFEMTAAIGNPSGDIRLLAQARAAQQSADFSLPDTKLSYRISSLDRSHAWSTDSELTDGSSAHPESSGEQLNFDALWYVTIYPDVAASGGDPLAHYKKYGHAEGRFPNAQAAIERKENLRDGLIGSRPFDQRWPTILLCGHASGIHLFGAERSFLDVLDAFQSLSVNLLVTIPNALNSQYVSDLKKRSSIVFTIQSRFWSAKSGASDWATQFFEFIIKKHNVRFVHVNTVVLREPLLAARNLGLRTILHVHESLDADEDICRSLEASSDEIKREISFLADYVIANSKYTARAFENISKKLYILPNVVDLELFDIDNLLNGEIINVAIVSSNIKKKGISDFIEVARIVNDASKKLKFVIVGPISNHVIELKSEQPGGAFPENVRLAGYSSCPVDAIREANIVLNLSHVAESFGRTTLEAMAARRPVIAYDFGALSELIQDDVNGFLVPRGDTAAIALKILSLANDPEKLLAMGEEGRRIASRDFCPPKAREQLARLYGELLSA